MVKRNVEERDAKSKRAGKIKPTNITLVKTDKGERVALARNGLLQTLGPRDKPLEGISIRNGSTLHVDEGQEVTPGTKLVEWDPHSTPIVTDRGGRVHFEDVLEHETLPRRAKPGNHPERRPPWTSWLR